MEITLKLPAFLTTKTISHFLVTSSGTALNGLLGLLFYIQVARLLGPADFGLLMISITTMTFLADIGDLGIDSGLVRFIGKYNLTEKELSLSFIKIGFIVKSFSWLIILSLGWLLSPIVAEKIFLKQEFTYPLRLALIGVGGAMYLSLITHAIQAFQRFWSWSILNIFLNGLRLLIILGLAAGAALSLTGSLLTYLLIPFLGFFLGLMILPNFLTSPVKKTTAIELFRYSKWIAILTLLTATSSRIDTFLSGRLLSSMEVGIYSAANQLAAIVPQVIFALATVVAPKLSAFDTKEKAAAYLKKLQLLTAGISVAGLLAIPISFWLIPVLFGQNYLGSIYPFAVLMVAQLIFLLALPSHQAIFYYFARPKVFTRIALGQLLVSIIFGWILISAYGAIGAAITVLLSNTLSLIISSVWVIRNFRSKQ